MKVILELEKGPQAGQRYELTENAYRAIGRSGDGSTTVQFTAGGDHVLDPEEVARIEAHLAKRPSKIRDDPANLRFGNFHRGRDILLPDSKISRTHAMCFVDEHGPSIVDLCSTNGTIVNGQEVSDADLADGDIVHVGQARFVVHVVP